MIKNNIMGKKITKSYGTKVKRNAEGLLENKPKIESTDNVEWIEILSFNGTNIRANNDRDYEISIGDNEKEKDIVVFKEEFRADKNEMVLYTHKEIEVIEEKKYESEQELAKLICEYNKQEIEKDNKLFSYCKVHNLIPEYTDVDELKKIVYEGETKYACGGHIKFSDLCYSSDAWVRIKDNSQTIL